MGDELVGVVDERYGSGSEEEAAGGEEEGEEWEDADSSDGETFFLDPDGRIPFAGEVLFGFRSAPRAFGAALTRKPEVLARVVKDCQTVFTARAKKLEYSTGETFWMQADAVPRNTLERLALDIFEAHTRRARFNRATSGAEWWTQVIEDTDDIGWHWDKDYGMEAQGVNVHPCLATVTYLSANGGPTVILEKQGPMACDDVHGVSGEAKMAWVSRPALGKHICFDGRFLHAAPSDLAVPTSPPPPTFSLGACSRGPAQAQEARISGGGGGGGGNEGKGAKKRDKDGELKVAAVTGDGRPAATVVNGTDDRGPAGGDGSRKRTTFLVNVWLNHIPKTAAPLPEATATELGQQQLAASLAPDDFIPPEVICVSGDDPAAVDMRWEFGEVGDEAERHLLHQVVVPVPSALSPACVRPEFGSPEQRKQKESAATGVANSGSGSGSGSGGGGDGCDSCYGTSFCVEYPSARRRPQVVRIVDGENERSSEDDEDDENAEGDDEHERDDGREDEEEERKGRVE